MDTCPRTKLALAPMLLVLALAGCAAPGADHRHGADAAGYESKGGATAGMDMQQMCDMHRQRMAATPAAEREAMMQERMKSMSPEMRMQMQEMMRNCR